MLVWVFHCCSRSQPYKLNVILAIYGLSLPLCLSGPMHSMYSTHLVVYFTWHMFPVPRNWTSASWKGQFRCQDSGIIILLSTPVSSNPSNIVLFVHTLSFGLWSFKEVYQNICVFPIVLKILPLLTNNIFTVVVAHLPGPLKLIEVSSVG